MRVALITSDKPGALQIRLDNRDAHLTYIEETGVVEMVQIEEWKKVIG